MKLVYCVAALLLGLTVSCANKIEGAVTIDDRSFPIEGCESGQRNGFAGVDFLGRDGRRLRVVQTRTGTQQVLLFDGETAGKDLGPCGSLTIERQTSTVNEITNVRGQAQLDCASNGHRVKGSVRFENCH